MASFSPTFSKQFSNLCQTLTVTDTSNYTNNDDNYTRETFAYREVYLEDLNNNRFDIKRVTSGDSVTFTLDLLSLNQIQLRIGFVWADPFKGASVINTYTIPCLI